MCNSVGHLDFIAGNNGADFVNQRCRQPRVIFSATNERVIFQKTISIKLKFTIAKVLLAATIHVIK